MSYADRILSLAPVAFYEFLEASGPTCADSSGFGEDGTYEDTITFQQPGPIAGDASCYAVNMAGTGSLLLDGLNIPSGDLSIEMWVKSTVSGQYDYLVQASTSKVDTFTWGGITPGQISYYIDGVWHAFGSAPTDGAWHHLVFVYFTSGWKARVYLDAVQLGEEKTFADPVNFATASQLKVGRQYNTKGSYFNGQMFGLAFYNKALTQEEIRDNYAYPSAIVIDSPLFSESIFSQLSTSIPAYDGTLIGDTCFGTIPTYAECLDGVALVESVPTKGILRNTMPEVVQGGEAVLPVRRFGKLAEDTVLTGDYGEMGVVGGGEEVIEDGLLGAEIVLGKRKEFISPVYFLFLRFNFSDSLITTRYAQVSKVRIREIPGGPCIVRANKAAVYGMDATVNLLINPPRTFTYPTSEELFDDYSDVLYDEEVTTFTEVAAVDDRDSGIYLKMAERILPSQISITCGPDVTRAPEIIELWVGADTSGYPGDAYEEGSYTVTSTPITGDAERLSRTAYKIGEWLDEVDWSPYETRVFDVGVERPIEGSEIGYAKWRVVFSGNTPCDISEVKLFSKDGENLLLSEGVAEDPPFTYTFPTTVRADTASVTCGDDDTHFPTDVEFQYFDGETAVTWKKISGLTWMVGETKTFNLLEHKYWELELSNPEIVHTSKLISEVEMATRIGEDSVCVGGVVYGVGDEVNLENLFDGNEATDWTFDDDAERYVGYEFLSETQITQVRVRFSGDDPGYAPTSISLRFKDYLSDQPTTLKTWDIYDIQADTNYLVIENWYSIANERELVVRRGGAGSLNAWEGDKMKTFEVFGGYPGAPEISDSLQGGSSIETSWTGAALLTEIIGALDALSGAAMIEQEATDGLALGETAERWLGRTLRDGVLVGKTLKSVLHAVAEAIDRVETSDASVLILRQFTEVFDAIKTADSGHSWLHLLLQEAVKFSEDLLSVMPKLDVEVIEGISLSDDASARHLIFMALVDAVKAGEMPTGQTVWVVKEGVKIGETLLSKGTLHRTIFDGVKLKDALRLTFQALAQEAVGLSGTPMYGGQIMMMISESLVLSEAVGNRVQADVVVSLAIALGEDVGSGLGFEITEGFQLTEDLAARWLRHAAALDKVRLADAPTYHVRLGVSIKDKAILVDGPPVPNQKVHEMLLDGVNIFISFRESGDTFTGYAMNTENGAVSSYTNFPFNSLTVWDGRAYGASDEGVFELTSDAEDDAGTDIRARIKTGLMDFGTRHFKRLPEVRIGVRADGRTVLKVTTGESVERWYELLPSTDAGMKQRRIKLPKGVRSVFWEMEMVSIDGASFDVTGIQFFPVVLDRGV